MKDVFGFPIICDGGWNSPSNIEQFITMVGNLHIARGQRDSFLDHCEQCRVLENNGTHNHGCIQHRGGLRLFRTGNPCKIEIMEAVSARNNIDALTYTTQGDIAFTPMEVLDKRG